MRLSFTPEDWQRARRWRQSRAQRTEGRNLRAAVESTVRSVTHPFPAGKLPVRGRFRVACMVIGSAAVLFAYWGWLSGFPEPTSAPRSVGKVQLIAGESYIKTPSRELRNNRRGNG